MLLAYRNLNSDIVCQGGLWHFVTLVVYFATAKAELGELPSITCPVSKFLSRCIVSFTTIWNYYDNGIHIPV